MKKFFTLAFIAFAVVAASSCKKLSNTVDAIVTVKSAVDSSCYLQLTDKIALVPTNATFQTNPFKKNVRARVFYDDLGKIESSLGGYEWRKVTLTGIDTIRTKKPAEPGTTIGNAGIELYNSWMTNFEDGYLTLLFEGWWGTSAIPHVVSLEKTDDLYTFTLKHYDMGDSPIYRVRGLIAFDLNDIPFPTDTEFDIIVKYKGYLVDRAVKFHCNKGVYVRTSSADDSYME